MLTSLLHRYTQALLNQIAQTAACNRAHPIDQRACRWILQTHDRVGAKTFALTQEFLAQMLGVRRASVNEVQVALQRRRLFTYQRGQLTVVNRKQLETCSCECYFVVSREYDRLVPGRAPRSKSAGSKR